MSRVKELYENINDLLDNTNLLTDDIAKKLQCPVEMVQDVVVQRWNEGNYDECLLDC